MLSSIYYLIHLFEHAIYLGPVDPASNQGLIEFTACDFATAFWFLKLKNTWRMLKIILVYAIGFCRGGRNLILCDIIRNSRQRDSRGNFYSCVYG